MGQEFLSEREMVETVMTLLSSGASPWEPSGLKKEFEYGNGRTDVIALLGTGTVLALEAKLTRWRVALQQAYRNTCFAHRSMVILPWHAAERACAHRHEFERRNVGLCAVKSDALVMLIEPTGVKPLLPHLTSRAIMELGQEAYA